MGKERKLYLFFAVLIITAFILVIIRLYYLQVMKHEDRVVTARGKVDTMLVRGKRGTIYDRNGMPLAMSVRKVNIAVDPKGVKNKDFVAGIIAEYLDTNYEHTLELLKKNSNFRYIKKDVPYEEVADLKKAIEDQAVKMRDSLDDQKTKEERDEIRKKIQDLSAIIFEDGYKRVYPQGKLLANVLGFAQADKSGSEPGPEGLEGIERKYDEYLSGRIFEVKKKGKRRIYDGEIDVESELSANGGKDIYLTIDSEIQFVAEEELAKMMEKVKAKWGGVVIMEPSSGKILAMANYPTFDPANFGKYPPETKRNYAVSNLFEPGSIFKSFSILAVLNENLAKPGELVYGENGSFIFGKKRVRDSHPNQWMTIRDVIVTSSNIGTIKFADRLTNKQLYDYFSLLGFGQKSGINISGEANKAIRDYKKWYPIDKGNISFGQGISVNMVQMARAYSAIYNGGVLWKPVLVDRVVGSDNVEKVFVPEPKRINFEYKSDKKIIDMLEGVVSDAHGTARTARLKGVEVGGKTGTSQIYDPVLKKFSWNKVVCSFIGAAPNNDPKFVMIVVVDEPQGREFGGSAAAPVFKAIASRILPKFGVYVDRDDKEKDTIPNYKMDMTGDVIEFGEAEKNAADFTDYVKVPDFAKMTVADAFKLANGNSLEVVFVGDQATNQKIIGQSPKAGDTVLAGTMVTLYTEDEGDRNDEKD